MSRYITKREREVLGLISYGYTVNEIASQLYLSKHTIISHKKNLMLKLSANNIACVVRIGFETGILEVQSS